MSYGKGLKPSPSHQVGLGHPVHLAGQVLPWSAEVTLPPPVDQGQTSSCTGNASAVAICQAMTESAKLPAGRWAPLPSRLFLYFHARAIEGGTAGDDGAALSDVFEGAALLGVPPESAWTFSEDIAKISAQPDWAAYRAAADQRIVKGAWRILSTGAQRVQDVKAAIVAGNPVVWGTLLDDAFERLGPTDVWPGVTGQVIGGHAMVLHRYDGDTFWTRSSWGANFADAGSARMASAAVASNHASDFWVVATAQNFPGVS